VGDAIRELAGGVAGVVGESLGCGSAGPATFVLEGLGQIPVEERGVRLDAGGLQFLEEALVKVEAFGIGRARALRENARPSDGEAECFRAQFLHERDILLVAVKEIVGDIGRFVMPDFARCVAEGVPHRGPAAVGIDGAFDLIGCSGGTPEESLWE
jgi:hypothetical protein